MSWYDHPIDSLEAEASEVEVTLVDWVAPGAGYVVSKPKPAATGEDVPYQDKDGTWKYPTNYEDEALAAYAKSSVSDTVDKAIVVAKEGVEKLKQKETDALTLIDWLTKPWVLGGIAVVVTLAVAGPYVLPFIRKAG